MKYTAIIVEPRKHNALEFVLNNFLENLSDEWGILIFHGSMNVDYMNTIVDGLDPKYKPRMLTMINLHIDNLNSLSYSKLFVNPALYNFIPTETFLVFQTDSMILPENKHLINDFLEYDYVGSPWSNGIVGNGGLSLRKKSKMLEIISHKKYENMNEDMYFSHNIPSYINYHVPSFEQAKTFAIETVFHDSPFGVHNFWRYLSTEKIQTLLNKYPYIQTLIEYNK
jgi:hypothetical protein